ncbi:MAG: heparinase II/III family protein [Anaerolineales bacterium]
MLNLKSLLQLEITPDPLLDQIRTSPGTPVMLAALRSAVPELGNFPHTTYTLYREFERTGLRGTFQSVYFARRAQLTRAVLEMIIGDISRRDIIHDLLWSICEETTWVLPAHEEQGPAYWDLHPSPRQHPWGSHTALTRAPDSIDLFAAETGASLAETIYLLGDQLAPEVCQRVRQEVERHIFKPYLAYGRQHWWFKGDLNWNGVCNGAIGLAFLRLEKDPQVLAEALEMVLEGFETYITRGFEPDGGSIEGISYWNYGLMYYVTLAELLRERTNGTLDLLAAPRMVDIARYPLAMALSPGTFVNFGDAQETLALEPGIVSRIAERTGVTSLKGLLISPEKLEGTGVSSAKLAIILRDAAWWDGQYPGFPGEAHQDRFLPDCAIVKFAGQTSQGQPVIMVAKAGHNDGHHSHTDIGHFILHVAGESLLCDPGRGLYSREYFRQQRYENFFNNSLSHSVPRIGGHLQMPGPEFGGKAEYHGKIVEHGETDGRKFAFVDLQPAYDIPRLEKARREISFEPVGGEVRLEDNFAFAGETLSIEEALLTWFPVRISGGVAEILGSHATLKLQVMEPSRATLIAEDKSEECRINQREGRLTRIAIQLPPGSDRFVLKITPMPIQA